MEHRQGIAELFVICLHFRVSIGCERARWSFCQSSYSQLRQENQCRGSGLSFLSSCSLLGLVWRAGRRPQTDSEESPHGYGRCLDLVLKPSTLSSGVRQVPHLCFLVAHLAGKAPTTALPAPSRLHLPRSDFCMRCLRHSLRISGASITMLIALTWQSLLFETSPPHVCPPPDSPDPPEDSSGAFE